jgi:hypothetical protein
MIRVKRIGELGTTLLLILVTLIMEATSSSETSLLIRAMRRHIPENGIFHSPRRENFKSYIAITGWTP